MTPIRLAVLALVATFVFAGCGGSDKGVSGESATKLMSTAKKQLADEKYVKVAGKGTDKDKTEIGLNLGFAGDTASGSVEISGVEIKLLRADGKSYFKGSDDFYRSAAGSSADQIIKLVHGRWVVAEESDPNFGDIASFTTKKKFFGDLLTPDGKFTKGKDKKVNGIDCVSVQDDTGVLYLDKSDGKPIQIVSKSKGDKANFTYDKLDEAKAPAADDIVDLSKVAA